MTKQWYSNKSDIGEDLITSIYVTELVSIYRNNYMNCILPWLTLTMIYNPVFYMKEVRKNALIWSYIREENQLPEVGKPWCILTTLSITKLPMCAVLKRCVPQQGSTDARDATAPSCWPSCSPTAMTCTVLGYTSPGTSVMLPWCSSSWKLMVRRWMGCPWATQLCSRTSEKLQL